MDQPNALSALRRQLLIIGALILRDIRSRMMGSAWGYARFILLPVAHLLAITTLSVLAGRAAPLGTDRVVFFASGVLPFMLFIYPIRTNVMSIEEGRILLIFPVIYPLDLVLAKVTLEAINSFALIALLFIILYFYGADIMPRSPYKTLTGIFATILFSLSFCTTHAVMARLVKNWVQVCVLIAVMMYLTSGAFLLPSMLPEQIQTFLYFNPLAHCVEWIRSGYYETYKEGLLDKSFLIAVILFHLLMGFILERAFRGKLN